jgi:predicted transcriptional regulator
MRGMRSDTEPTSPDRTLWAPRRARSGIGITALAERSGVNKGLLSLMERGRLMPTASQYEAVIAALDELEAERPN